jgi:hypothetical protein
VKVMPKIAPAARPKRCSNTTKTDAKRQQARGGEPGGVSESAGAALAVEKDLMVQRRRYEKADTQKHKS